jgi:hypothetical protein
VKDCGAQAVVSLFAFEAIAYPSGNKQGLGVTVGCTAAAHLGATTDHTSDRFDTGHETRMESLENSPPVCEGNQVMKKLGMHDAQFIWSCVTVPGSGGCTDGWTPQVDCAVLSMEPFRKLKVECDNSHGIQSIHAQVTNGGRAISLRYTCCTLGGFATGFKPQGDMVAQLRASTFADFEGVYCPVGLDESQYFKFQQRSSYRLQRIGSRSSASLAEADNEAGGESLEHGDRDMSVEQVALPSGEFYLKQPGHGAYLGMCGSESAFSNMNYCDSSFAGVFGYTSKHASYTKWKLEDGPGDTKYLKQSNGAKNGYVGFCGGITDCGGSQHGVFGYSNQRARGKFYIQPAGNGIYYVKQPDHGTYMGMCGGHYRNCGGSSFGVQGFHKQESRTQWQIEEIVPPTPQPTHAAGDKMYVLNGCPANNGANDQFLAKTQKAGVRCCSSDGSTCTTPGSCPGSSTYAQAQQICSYSGRRICSKLEIESSKCCGTGGGCDAHPTWTSTPAPVLRAKGCPDNGAAVSSPDKSTKGGIVQCCSNDGSTCARSSTLDQDYASSVSICSGMGKRLCTVSEVDARRCCGTGYGGDFMSAWTFFLGRTVTNEGPDKSSNASAFGGERTHLQPSIGKVVLGGKQLRRRRFEPAPY